MGNSPSVEYAVGTVVEARYDGNQTEYYAAKIVRKHEYGRYDVQFLCNNKIVTVFWDDIKGNGNGQIIESSERINTSQHSTSHSNSFLDAFSIFNRNEQDTKLDENIHNKMEIKTFNIVFDMDDNDIQNDKEWNKLIENIDSYLENKHKIELKFAMKRNNNLNMKQLKKLEKLLFQIGGKQLCENIIFANKQKTCEYIQKCIENASEQKTDIKYINKLKSIEIINDNKNANNQNNIWNKYGLNYKISMDLNYDILVLNNDRFKDEIINELTVILNVNKSLINIINVGKGSVIIECTLCGIGLMLLFFGYLGMNKVSYYIKKRFNRKESKGEMLLDINIGDSVMIDWKDKMYEGKVIEKFEGMVESWVKVEYIGKPFMFQNTEKLELSSQRLHMKEPGYEYQANVYPNKDGNVSFEVLPISYYE